MKNYFLRIIDLRIRKLEHDLFLEKIKFEEANDLLYGLVYDLKNAYKPAYSGAVEQRLSEANKYLISLNQ